jgi:ABC-type transport system involved in multi-copper enzyme maturation permease subunit
MIGMLKALVRRSFARSWRGVAAVVLVLSAFQIAAVLIASSLTRSRTFSQLAAIVPAFIGDAVGGTAQMVASFGGVVGFGFFHPVVLLALVQGAVYLASEPADEVERGLVDLVAARPVPRHLLVTRGAVAAGSGVAVTVLAMMATSLIAVRLFAPPTARPLGAYTTGLLALHLGAVAGCFGGASLLVAAYARRRSAAVGGIGLLAVFLFLVDFAASSWAPLASIAPLTPFHYYKGMSLLLGTTNPGRDLTVLFTATAILVGWAYAAYGRRDL